MRAGRSVRQFRDPDSLAAVPPSQAELSRIGYWNAIDRLEMDAQFASQCRLR